MAFIVEKSVKEQLKDTYLWRYMSLPKFLDLITTQEMYFANNKQLTECDPYEGRLPIFTDLILAWIKQINFYKQAHPDLPDYIMNIDSKKIEKIHKTLEEIKEYTFINCWHINDDENYLMWQSYAQEKGGVAIVTDIYSLIEAFETDIEIEAVPVIYDTNEIIKVIQPIFEDLFNKKYNVYNFYKNFIRICSLYKKEFFKNENELRLIFQKSVNNRVKVNLNKLIKHIYISPNSTECEKKIITDTINKLKLKGEVNIDAERIIHNSLISKTYVKNTSNFIEGTLSMKNLINNSTLEEEQKKRHNLGLYIMNLIQYTPPHKSNLKPEDFMIK